MSAGQGFEGLGNEIIGVKCLHVRTRRDPRHVDFFASFGPQLGHVAQEVLFIPRNLWVADAKTLYVANEGNGDATYGVDTGLYPNVASQTSVGLQKWVFDAGTGAWNLAYVLSAGLDRGVPYTVAQFPTGNNAATGLPWSPATDGLRNITGRVNRDGAVTIWGMTSTVGGNGDQGADSNKLVAIIDKLAATSAPASEDFRTVRTARFGEVLRDVSFTPGTVMAQIAARTLPIAIEALSNEIKISNNRTAARQSYCFRRHEHGQNAESARAPTAEGSMPA